MDIFTILFYQPIFNLVVVLYRLFSENLGLAIIGIALLSRIVTIPITLRQIKMAESSREFNDKMKAIKEKHKNNKDKQNEELMKLQSEYLPSQIAGCLPLIVQFILLININHVINELFTNGANSFSQIAYPFVPTFAQGYQINQSFLGINLSATPSSIGFGNLGAVLPYLVLALLVGLSQYASTKILLGMQQKKKPVEESKPKKTKAKGIEEAPDFAEVMQKSTQQTAMILPFLLIFMSLNFPAGLSLYWTVQSGFVIIQQFIVEKFKRDGGSKS
jgi:YidC/Oxa1 family membrane protein insertase